MEQIYANFQNFVDIVGLEFKALAKATTPNAESVAHTAKSIARNVEIITHNVEISARNIESTPHNDATCAKNEGNKSLFDEVHFSRVY